MYKYIFTLCLVFSSHLCVSQEYVSAIFKQESKPVFVAIEYGFETKGQEDINSIGLKVNFARYHRDNFATSIECKIRKYQGFRTEIENNTLSFGIGYAINYHFLNIRQLTTFVDCGFGAAYTLEPFPTKGTNINGQYYFGLGLAANYKKLTPIITVRYYHSSNGSGSGVGNPAYDGLFFSLGMYL